MLKYNYRHCDSSNIELHNQGSVYLGLAFFCVSGILFGVFFLTGIFETSEPIFQVLQIVASFVPSLAGFFIAADDYISSNTVKNEIVIRSKFLGFCYSTQVIPFSALKAIEYQTEMHSRRNGAHDHNRSLLNLITDVTSLPIYVPEREIIDHEDPPRFDLFVFILAANFDKLDGLKLGIRLAIMTAVPFRLYIGDHRPDGEELSRKVEEIVRKAANPESAIEEVNNALQQLCNQIH